jgi:hypothetical protein
MRPVFTSELIQHMKRIFEMLTLSMLLEKSKTVANEKAQQSNRWRSLPSN